VLTAKASLAERKQTDTKAPEALPADEAAQDRVDGPSAVAALPTGTWWIWLAATVVILFFAGFVVFFVIVRRGRGALGRHGS
jgi:hypothetical protein